jgi:outer membrane protein W
MRLRLVLTIALVTLCTAPAYSQGADLIGWASWVDLGEQEFDQSELEFDSSVGFGVSANWFWMDRFSTELTAMALEADASLETEVGIPELDAFDFGTLDMTALMVTFQFHVSPDSTFDPYFGLGAAYVITDDLDSEDLRLLEIGAIEIDDEFSFVVNAGVGFAITPNFGINLDARYIPLEPAARAINDPQEVDLELNPLIVSLGLRFRFGQ